MSIGPFGGCALLMAVTYVGVPLTLAYAGKSPAIPDREREAQAGALPVNPWSKLHILGRLLNGLQIFCCIFSGPRIGDNVEGHALSFIKALHPCTFDRLHVNEHISSTVIRLDEPEALLAVEPLHGSLRHVSYPKVDAFGAATAPPFRGRYF